ncbi:DASH complex subunit Hsk3 like-domain-containing protein [Aspergillus spinulosporus]
MSSTHNYTHSYSNAQSHSQSYSVRHSMAPSGSSSTMSAAKSRQYAQLESKLAELNANLANTKSLLEITAVQARDMRFLGGYVGALFMGAANVLGEEGVKKTGQAEQAQQREGSEDR